MKRFFLYIIPLLTFLASCKDELTYFNPNLEAPECDGYSLSLQVDVPDIRTRAIDMNEGAGLYLNDLWVGVYRQRDGMKVGGAKLNLQNRLTASGVMLYNIVKLNLNSIPVETADQFCVVAVANYDGIRTTENQDLESALDDADYWSKFKNLAIDTKNSTFLNQTPLLMGYLYKESISTGNGISYTKVNQFVSDENKVELYGFGSNENYVFVEAKENNVQKGLQTTYIDDDKEKKNYILKLRRLRSKINVNITTRKNDLDEREIEVTNLEYMVYNQPKTAFLAQRRTNTLENHSYISEEYSPNHADMEEGRYENDLTWNRTEDNYNFSFEHFENKHWAIKDFSGKIDKDYKDDVLNYYTMSYHYREEKNSDGTLKPLVGDKSDSSSQGPDWNNNASFFVIRMNLRDLKSGKNAEIDYIVHEGFCNDQDGLPLVDDYGNTLGEDEGFKKRLMDFSCIRNTDYYYNIHINSFDDITTWVTTDDGNNHPFDQLGSIWKINYITDHPEDKYVVTEWNGGEKELKEDITFNKEANFDDIAFRFIDSYYDDEAKKFIHLDICYNFARGDLDGFAGLWREPDDNTVYLISNEKSSAYQSFQDYKANNPGLFFKSKNKILIGSEFEGKNYITIDKYLEKIYNDNKESDDFQKLSKISGFKYPQYQFFDVLDNVRDNYMRALYIFDKEEAMLKGVRIGHDGSYYKSSDGKVDDWFHGSYKDNKWTDSEAGLGGSPDCRYYQIYGTEQYPRYIKGEKYEILYANEKSEGENQEGYDQIRYDGGTFSEINGGKGMLFSDSPDIAFRLLGYDGDVLHDFCYNFDPKDYPEFEKFWAKSRLDNPTKIVKNSLNSEDIPQSLLEGMKILIDNGSSLDVKKFVERVENPTYKKNNILGFEIGQYYKTVIGDPLPYLRALYIFDKNTIKPGEVNESNFDHYIMDDKDIAHFSLYSAEQLPDWKLIEIPFNESIMLWDYNFYNVLKTNNNEKNWFGSRDISTLMYWKHQQGIKGYKVQVSTSAGFKEEYIEINKNNIDKYFLDANKDIIACPFPTTRYSGSLDVVITPDFDKNIVSNSPMQLTLTNALNMHGTTDATRTWNFSAEPWSNLSINDFSVCSTNQVKYDGLFLKHTGTGGTYPSTPPQSGDPYIQFGSKGDRTNNYFCIIVSEPGEITVKVSNTGANNNTDRYVYLYEEFEDKEILLNPNGLTGTNPVLLKQTVTPNQPTRYYIYCDNNCRYYEITFTRYRAGGTTWPGIIN